MTEKQRSFIEIICDKLKIKYDSSESICDAKKWISEHIDALEEVEEVEELERQEMSGDYDNWALFHGYI